ncbi:MAG: hypothetical protein Q9159_004052 [Coniocarpon cinnabarinum]
MAGPLLAAVALAACQLGLVVDANPQFDFLAPVPTEASKTGAFRNASFDDVVIVDNFLNFQHMVPGYMGLYWENMTAVLDGGGLLPGGPLAGVPAHSGSQVAAFSPQLFSMAYGIPLPQVPLGAAAALSTSWLGSKAREFDLQEFWFGCFTSSPQSVISNPQACVLDVSGWRQGTPTSSAPHAQQSFVYYANNFIKAPMMYAKMESDQWRGLQRVEFRRRTVGMLDKVIEGVLMDDVAIVVR